MKLRRITLSQMEQLRGKKIEKICINCGKKFYVNFARRHRAKFCSHLCYWKSGLIKNCGKAGRFTAERVSGDKNPAKRPEVRQKISDSLIGNENFKQALLEGIRLRELRGNNAIKRDEVKIKMVQANHDNGSYKRLSDRMKGLNNPSKKTDIRNRLSELAKLRVGPLHPNWKGESFPRIYKPEFSKKLKEVIRWRDKNVCQECGCLQRDLRYKLHIHHVDYDKTNNQSNNLVSLCRNCHMKTGFNRESWINRFQSREMLSDGCQH